MHKVQQPDAGRCRQVHQVRLRGRQEARGGAGRAGGGALAPVAWAGKPGEKPGKIRGAWLLARQSWRVLMLDKELLVFPLVSGIACLLVLATFVGGAFATGIAQRETAPNEGAAWALAFAYYFANYFVIVFFNAALVACAMIRFEGGNPAVGDGLRAASARLPQILAWALLAATVGIVLRMIQERALGHRAERAVPLRRGKEGAAGLRRRGAGRVRAQITGFRLPGISAAAGACLHVRAWRIDRRHH